MIILKTTEYLRCDTREDTSELLRILKDMGADINYTGEQDGRGIFMIRAHSRSCIYVAKPFFTPTYCQKFTVGEEIYYSYEDMLNSGRYFSKSNLLDCDTDEVKFAKKSDLYNKIMLDGNVFNPYIHRRFLPHQYIHLIEQYSGDIDAAISREYHFKYALEYTKKEVKKLSLLFWIDRKTFKERSRFFNYNVIYSIIKQALDFFAGRMRGRAYYYVGNRRLCGYDIAKFIASGEKMLRDIISSNSYAALSNIIEKSDIYDLLCEDANRIGAICKEWNDAFKASGAYYTMKHLIMFEGYLFREGQSQIDAVRELESMLAHIDADTLHNKCVVMLHDNIRINVD